MARKPRETQSTQTDVDDDDILEDQEPEDEAFERVLAELSGEGGEDARIFLYRDIKGKSTGAELFSMSPAEFDLAAICEKLREDYGTGDYRAILKKGGRIKKAMPLAVEVPKSRVATSAPVAGNQDNTLITLLTSQAQRSAEDARLAQESMNKMMLAIVQGKNNAPQSTMKETLEILALLNNAKGDKSDPIDSLLKGIELGKQLAEGGGGENPILAGLKAMAPVIQKGMEVSLATQKALPARVNPKLPKPTKVIEKTESDENAHKEEFNVLCRMIKRAADKGSDPELYADWLIDQIGEEALAQYMLEDMDYDLFVLMVPGGLTEPQKEWLDMVRESVLTSPDDTSGEIDGEHVSDDDGGEGSPNPP